MSGIRFMEDAVAVEEEEEERRAEAAAAAAGGGGRQRRLRRRRRRKKRRWRRRRVLANRPAEPRAPPREWSRLFVLAGSQPTRFRVVSRSDTYLVTGPPTPRRGDDRRVNHFFFLHFDREVASIRPHARDRGRASREEAGERCTWNIYISCI